MDGKLKRRKIPVFNKEDGGGTEPRERMWLREPSCQRKGIPEKDGALLGGWWDLNSRCHYHLHGMRASQLQGGASEWSDEGGNGCNGNTHGGQGVFSQQAALIGRGTKLPIKPGRLVMENRRPLE